MVSLLVPLPVRRMLVSIVLALALLLLPSCAGFDAARGLRFGVDLVGAICELLDADSHEQEWLVYACKYAPAAGAILEDQIGAEAAPAAASFRVRVHKDDRQAFEARNARKSR